MTGEKPALILFSHGSLLCGAGRTLRNHAVRLRSSGKWLCVEPAYLNYSRPTFEEAAGRCAAAGARQVVVAPYFLVSGKFVTQDLPPQIAIAREAYPQLNIVLAGHIGFHPAMADAVIEMAATARPPAYWRETLDSAAVVCEARANCPLYGSPACPAAPLQATS